MEKKPNVGGQAVIEGVMMRGKDKIAVAVRQPDGEIAIDVGPAAERTAAISWIFPSVLVRSSWIL